MVWDRERFRFLPSFYAAHPPWGENQTTLCSFLQYGVRTGGNTGTRIPSVDDGISSSASDSGKSPLPLRDSQIPTKSRIRLDAVRNVYRSGLLSVDDVLERYKAWVSEDEYLLLQRSVIEPGVHATTKWDSQFIAVKCSKRGNDVYRHRVRERLSFIQKAVPDVSFFNPRDRDLVSKKIRTPMVSVTLTYDVERCSLSEAWQNIGKEFDQLQKNLREKFGKIRIIRTWEAFQNGYPHIHAVMLFEEKEFQVFRVKSKFRIKEKREFSKHWHSFVDVQAVASIRSAVNYITKYITKDLFSEKATQTRAMLWLFRKRTYSISKNFPCVLSRLTRLDYNMHNSQQLSITGVKLTQIVWRFLGIFEKSELQIEENVWNIQIPTKIVQDLIDI